MPYGYYDWWDNKSFENDLKLSREQYKIKRKRYLPRRWYTLVYNGR